MTAPPSGPLARPQILSITPYVGGESHAPGAKQQIRLAANETPFGPSPAAVAACRALAGDLHRYPDGGSTALRAAIAATHGIEAEQIVCGTGSDELITLLAVAYADTGCEVIHTAHAFLVYGIAARSVGATPMPVAERSLTADVDAILSAITDRTRLVYLANPNNPTGTYLPTEELARLQAGLPAHVLLVIDAAYAEYVTATNYDPGIALVRAHPNVVMTRTFSKIYGLGAVRLGWAYCPPAVADILNRIRGPFNVNAMAQAAGMAALADQERVAMARAHNAEWRIWTAERLRDLGLTVHPTAANFLLVSFADATRGTADADAAAERAEAARQYLKRSGILVRQMGGYGLPDCLRITIGLADDMRAVVKALAGFLGR